MSEAPTPEKSVELYHKVNDIYRKAISATTQYMKRDAENLRNLVHGIEQMNDGSEELHKVLRSVADNWEKAGDKLAELPRDVTKKLSKEGLT